MKRGSWIALCFFLLAAASARAQFYSAGTDPGSVRWSEIRTENYRLIYPRGTDSLARAYALSLQTQYPRIGRSLGFAPSQLCRKPMPVILHPFTSFGNGMVMWAPRRMELYTLGDPADPDPMPWMLNLTTHEPRHAAQLQFGRRWPYKALRLLTGDLSDVAWWSVYTGIAFSEGDAVVTETALTESGRGRTADFLEYVRVAFDEGDWRDYYRWRYGSLKRFTPDHYRAGYLLAAGLRTSWDEPFFLKKYHDNLFSRKLPLPFFNMQYTIRETTGLSFKDAFSRISGDFQAVWAANDSLRGPFPEDRALTPAGRRYTAFRGAAADGDDIYAVQTGLERAPHLVRITPGGAVQDLGPFASSASDLRIAAGRLYWSEERRGPRWELAGTAVVRMMDLASGRKRTLLGGAAGRPLGAFLPEGVTRIPEGGRYFNPAPSEDGTRLAAMHYAADGSHQVVIVDGQDGLAQPADSAVQIRILNVPAGLQPVQGAWLAEALYVSAISEAGFGVYEATDSWRCVLPGRAVKIKQLRSRAGRLWFACDKNGVNELYSCDPASGTLVRQTNLRHGGQDFVFNAAGDSLRYTVLSTGGRAFHVAPVGAFAAVESDWDAIWRHPVAEKLAEQERALEAADTCGGEILRCAQDDNAGAEEGIGVSEPKAYRKAAHLLRFHTWAPLYIDYDAVADLSLSSLYGAAGLGATAFFQNDLATASGSIAYHASRPAPGDWGHLLDLRFDYKGWYPVIESSLTLDSTTPSHYSFTRLTDIQGTESNLVSVSGLRGPGLSFSTRVYIPLSFSGGGWNRGFIPQLRYSIGNSLFDGSVHYTRRFGLFPEKDRSLILTATEPGETAWLQTLSASVRGYVMRPTAPSGVYPRWGVGAELGGSLRPALTRIYDPTVYGYLYGYLPGFLPEHGLKLTALVQRQWDPARTFIPEQRVVTYPRGFAATGSALGRYLAEHYPTQTKLTADYLMAILPVDWSGLGPVAYVKNFELGLHADAGLYAADKAASTAAGARAGQHGGVLEHGGESDSAGNCADRGALMSAGVSFCVRLGNLLWIPFDTRIGASWSVNFGPSFDTIKQAGTGLDRHYVGLLFSIDY
ncbi:MAG: hypothetical protein IJ654_01660 [Bacteroidales bacterium]|nr:hypothetical protein [Bacteroidales bacterium]